MSGEERNHTRKAQRRDGTTGKDQLPLLPDDVLADIFRRVPPRWLAASRCVCRAWREAVDFCGLLRADLLPLSLAGLFLHFAEHKFPEFLARPSSSAPVSGDLSRFLPSASPHCSHCARPVNGDLSLLPSRGSHCGYFCYKNCGDWYTYNIEDHCNGLLLLCGNYVVNPATRRWYTLPSCPSFQLARTGVCYDEYLVYDPMLSPYFEVFSTPTLDSLEETDPSMEESEWPPSVCKMYVFSSKSGRWEEKDFLRDGDAAGTVGKMQKRYSDFRSIYFRGALYVKCGDNFLMRLLLSNNTYNVIKPPMDLKVESRQEVSIARSEKGVYFLALYHYRLRVWVLNESSGQMEWMLAHDKDLKPMLECHRFYHRVHTPWILEDINYTLFRSSRSPEESNKPATTREILEWNSDDDGDDEKENMAKHSDSKDKKDCYSYGDIEILGLHPYKEVVFLSSCARTGLAYHLNSSKTEILGNIYPKEYNCFKALMNEGEEITCFPYTPCWIEEF